MTTELIPFISFVYVQMFHSRYGFANRQHVSLVQRYISIMTKYYLKEKENEQLTTEKYQD